MAKMNESKDGFTGNPVAILAVAAFAAFLATFNETFLNVGFAPIMEDLLVDVNTVQWLLDQPTRIHSLDGIFLGGYI